MSLITDATRPDGGVGSTSFWNYGRSVLDLLPSLRNYRYQLAPRSLLPTACKDDTTDPSYSPLSGDVRPTTYISVHLYGLCVGRILMLAFAVSQLLQSLGGEEWKISGDK